MLADKSFSSSIKQYWALDKQESENARMRECEKERSKRRKVVKEVKEVKTGRCR
jgi:hypothetical protein